MRRFLALLCLTAGAALCGVSAHAGDAPAVSLTGFVVPDREPDKGADSTLFAPGTPQAAPIPAVEARKTPPVDSIPGPIAAPAPSPEARPAVSPNVAPPFLRPLYQARGGRYTWQHTDAAYLASYVAANDPPPQPPAVEMRGTAVRYAQGCATGRCPAR